MSSPNKSFRSRMGGVMRRTSSVLTFQRPSPPASDAGSIKGVEVHTAPPPPPALSPPPPQPGVPSPIAESPLREAAANAAEAGTSLPDPSPLSQEVQPATETPVPEPEPAPAAAPEAQAPESERSEEPRIFESATGPGAFTDEPEEMLPRAQDEEIAKPHAPSNGDASPPPPPPPAPEQETEPPVMDTESPPSVPVEPTADVFVPEEIKPTPQEEDKEQESPSSQTTAKQTETIGEIPDHTSETISMPVAVVEETHTEVPLPITMPVANVEAPPAAAPVAPTYDLDIAGTELWSNTSKDSTPEVATKSIQMPVEDPFADPAHPSSPPKITVTHEIHGDSESISMSNPLHNVRPSRSIGSIRSGVPSSSRAHYEVDETRPLLSRPGTPQGYLHSSAAPRHHASSHGSLRGSGFPSSPWYSAIEGRRLHDLGWLEYPLPDTTLYFVHPTLRVTTDIDLRQPKKLDAVTSYLDRQKDAGERGVTAGMELWLRESPEESSKKRRGDWFLPTRAWVDHRKRSVISDAVWEGNGSGPRRGKHAEEDALDIEYRYWLFMEAHPAHVALPQNARTEAMDILTWAWTDRLLPSNRVVSAPFTQDECHELTNLLRTFGDHQGDQPILHTRIVARILLRAAQWRQLHFRPDKPLPKDAILPIPGRAPRRLPLRRVFLDFIVSCFCLGIPYLFFNRTSQHHMDEESGLRNASPYIMIGASTCLMAAIVLSASVTFLSLPGLDNISRLVGFVAILFASFSMASTLAAVFRYKADMERAVPALSGEGLMMLSRRSVIMSLPVVFLAYAVMAFVAALVLYSFRGVSLTDKNLVEHHFEDYTRWTVVGVFGALTGILFTSFLILRR